MSIFRNIIATMTFERSNSVDVADWKYHLDDADAMLAMPEMQAIRAALRQLAPCALHSEMRAEPGSKLAIKRAEMILESLGLQPHVIEWVMGE